MNKKLEKKNTVHEYFIQEKLNKKDLSKIKVKKYDFVFTNTQGEDMKLTIFNEFVQKKYVLQLDKYNHEAWNRDAKSNAGKVKYTEIENFKDKFGDFDL